MAFKKFIITNLVFLISFQISTQEKVISKKPITIGEAVTIHSRVLDEDRTLNIYLPHSYSTDSTKTYPVIYLLDGSIDEDFIHISGIVQFGSFPWINMIPETIVVGISNVDRKRDFTFPTTIKKDKEDFPTTGESKKFINFIETELHPFVNTNYKVNDTKTIIGQSLGGLLATEILLKKPNLFDNYIIVSPSLWWNNQSLLNLKAKTYTSEKKIYIAVGKEGDVMETDAKNLYKTLDANKKNNTTIHFGFFEEQNHGDTMHMAVYKAFEAMFRAEKRE